MKKAARNLFQLITSGISSLSLKRNIILSSFRLNRKKPVNLKQGEEKYFVSEFQKDFRPVTKVVIKHARLITEEGLVVKSFHVISESLLDESVRSWYGPAFIAKAYKQVTTLPEDKYLYVYNHYGVGYGHWLADILPRLFVVREELKDYKILLPENYNSFHLTSLLPFGIKDSQVIFLDKSKVYKVPDLTLISHVGSSCNTKDEILQEIRNFYLKFYVGENLVSPTRKLYISRSNMKHRRVINETETESLLRKHGFEIIYPEQYNFEQQVSLFSECKILIGLTGSGLTNMLFMREGGAIVEFKMEGDFTNLHYFSMASGMKLDYYYLLCSVNGEDRFTSDFNINIRDLESVIIQLNH